MSSRLYSLLTRGKHLIHARGKCPFGEPIQYQEDSTDRTNSAWLLFGGVLRDGHYVRFPPRFHLDIWVAGSFPRTGNPQQPARRPAQGQMPWRWPRRPRGCERAAGAGCPVAPTRGIPGGGRCICRLSGSEQALRAWVRGGRLLGGGWAGWRRGADAGGSHSESPAATRGISEYKRGLVFSSAVAPAAAECAAPRGSRCPDGLSSVCT